MHSIYRARKLLRDVSKEAYEPDIIAIGPYHYGQNSFKMMEEHKTRYLNILLEREGRTLDMFTKAIGGLEKRTRDCYAEPIELSSDEFTLMLVRDGCFIIELLQKNAGNRAREERDPIFQDGIIQMPSLTIEDRTECFFRNFIAHEHYSQDGSQANYVEDYAWLLNCLIDSPEDVDILCQAGIIINMLGDNRAVAQFVNRLSRTVCSPTKSFTYAATFRDINDHFERRRNRWRAVLRRDYCNSPWGTIAVIAASAILLLTLTQTVCSVLQLV